MIRLPILLLLPLAVGAVPAAAQSTAAPAPHAEPGAPIGAAAPILRRGALREYPYGRGRPELVCAPLRTCKVILEPEETLLAHASGDTERWAVSPMPGPGGATVVVIKPLACDVETDLTLSTDRRIYELLVRAPLCDARGQVVEDVEVASLVSFYYPDRAVVTQPTAPTPPDRVTAAVAADAAGRGGSLAVGATVTVPDLSVLEFDYEWRRDRSFPWLPDHVFDDGTRTHIRLPARAARFELPALFAVAPDGSLSVVNFVIRGAEDEYLVADRVLTRAVLVLGSSSDDRPVRLLIYKRGARR